MSFPAATVRSQPLQRRVAAPSGFRLSQASVQALAAVFEAGLVIVASLAARTIVDVGSPRPSTVGMAVGVGVVAALWQFVLAQALGLHRFSALLAARPERAAVVAVGVALLMMANVVVLHGAARASVGYLVTFGAVLFVVATGFRLVQARLLALGIEKQTIMGRPAVLIGLDEELAEMSARDLFRQFGLSEVARVLVPGSETDMTVIDRASAEAVALARVLRAEDLVVASPWTRPNALARLERGLRRSPLPVWLLPDASARVLMMRHRTIRGVDLVALQPAPLGAAARVGKRIADVVLAAGALLLLAPVLATIAIAVRLETRGPVLFRQRRAGFDQRVFTIFKFRTMTVMEDCDAVLQACRDDQRVTRVGRVLRRTSLDELPQLINVLRGEMALVGPRPHALAHDRQFDSEIDDYCVRHRVKPGITGWAQVNGLRGETRDLDRLLRRVEHDLWYVNNWSPSLDLRILLRTCREVLTHDAY